MFESEGNTREVTGRRRWKRVSIEGFRNDESAGREYILFCQTACTDYQRGGVPERERRRGDHGGEGNSQRKSIEKRDW